jgi:hypothetical protein
MRRIIVKSPEGEILRSFTRPKMVSDSSKPSEKQQYKPSSMMSAPAPAPAPLSEIPIIPPVIKKSMKNELLQDYDTHQYRIGLAHPIDDMIKYFRTIENRAIKIFGENNYFIASGFMTNLINWVTKNSHKALAFPFMDQDKTEQVLLVKDWENFFTVNKL